MDSHQNKRSSPVTSSWFSVQTFFNTFHHQRRSYALGSSRLYKLPNATPSPTYEELDSCCRQQHSRSSVRCTAYVPEVDTVRKIWDGSGGQAQHAIRITRLFTVNPGFFSSSVVLCASTSPSPVFRAWFEVGCPRRP